MAPPPAQTMLVVMPYYPTDLKNLLKSVRRGGAPFLAEPRALRLAHGLLLAVAHLKAHGVSHRDVKPDNVLVADPGGAREAAVLVDFGMSFDHAANRTRELRVPMPVHGFRRGGAAIALAPEVTLLRPGPGAVLDYRKNDEWAAGMVLHELLSREGGAPFADMEHPVRCAPCLPCVAARAAPMRGAWGCAHPRELSALAAV